MNCFATLACVVTCAVQTPDPQTPALLEWLRAGASAFQSAECVLVSPENPERRRLVGVSSPDGPWYIVEEATSGRQTDGRHYSGTYPPTGKQWTLSIVELTTQEITIRQIAPSRVISDLLRSPEAIRRATKRNDGGWTVDAVFPSNALWIDLRCCGSDPPNNRIKTLEFDANRRVTRCQDALNESVTVFSYTSDGPSPIIAARGWGGDDQPGLVLASARVLSLANGAVFERTHVERLAKSTPMPWAERKLRMNAPAVAAKEAAARLAREGTGESRIDWAWALSGVVVLGACGVAWWIRQRPST